PGCRNSGDATRRLGSITNCTLGEFVFQVIHLSSRIHDHARHRGAIASHSNFLMGGILALLTSLGLVTLAGWFLTVFMPLYGFACIVYVTVFMAMVCLKFREQFGEET
ncbi:MAG: hypothetical protein WCJ35_26340, partial [Planctomycetota bacterium]